MNSLGRRIEKLEATRPRAGNFAWVAAPATWTDEQCRQQCDAELRELFSDEDFELTIERAPNVEQMEVIYASTHQELDMLLDEIGRQGRKITDRQPQSDNTRKGTHHA